MSQICKKLFKAEHAKTPNILLYSAPGKEGFYQKLGYSKMKTAMALFENPEQQRSLNYIE